MKNKQRTKSRAIALACALALVTASTPRCFASDDAAAIAVDVVLVRPVCLIGTIIGSALFVISLPIAAISKSVEPAAKALVVRPAEATFKRPLGDFDDLNGF